MDYVWGYTIINDLTARERQRDHKQFYIGKSADTFCPMVYAGSSRLHKLTMLTRSGTCCCSRYQTKQSLESANPCEWSTTPGRHYR